MPAYEIDGIRPVVAPDAHVHPSAVLIGDVIVAERCYIGPCAVLRGDFGPLILQAGANLQDTCVMHGFPGIETRVEEDGHIGHGAVLHGCIIRKNAMVGMNAVVMDEAVIGENSIVGASSMVKAGEELPADSLIVGVPAKVIRPLGEAEIQWKTEGTQLYQNLSIRCQQSMKEVTPLSEAEPDRKHIDINFPTLAAMKRSL